LNPDDPTYPYNMAVIYQKMGRPAAIALLKEDLDQNLTTKKYAWADTDFDGIRDDPRFQLLVKPQN